MKICLSNATKTNTHLTRDYKTWKRYLEFESEIENQQIGKTNDSIFSCDSQYETFMASCFKFIESS